MKMWIIVLSFVGVILAVLAWFGGTPFFIGLGVVALTVIILVSFALGGYWTFTTMKEGARLAIESASRNDEHDATKIKALSELTREAIKAKNEAQANGGGYPALPPLNAIDGSFTIAGLESEELEQ